MASATPSPELPSPWKEFLEELDSILTVPVELTCLGGFVVAVAHGRLRTTGDLDYIEIMPNDALQDVQKIAGMGSELAKKYGVYLQHVTVADLPESYADRLMPLFPERFKKLRLREVEAHDLALSKLTRNLPVDREDVAYLVKTVPLDPEILKTRWEQELRPIVIGDVNKHEQTLRMWIESYFS